MKTQKILAIVLLIGLSLSLTACSLKKKEVVENTPKETTQNNEGTEMGSLLDLFKGGKTVQCTVGVEGESSYQQRVYVSGQKMRMDTTISTEEDKPVESHMIIDGDYAYAWSSMLPTGTKMNIKELGSSVPESVDKEKVNESLNALNQKVNYSCTPWIADPSLFELPTDVQFMDVSEGFKKLQDLTKGLDGTDTENSACAACELIPNDTLKAQCREQANCE